MKKWMLFLTLCISLLLSGCQKTPEAQPGTQPAEAPWADEQADAPLSYEDYFAELRRLRSRLGLRRFLAAR